MSESLVRKYYEQLGKGNIIAHRCNACDELTFPPTTMCQKCGSSDYQEVNLSGKGMLEYASHGAAPPPHPRFVDIAPYAYGHIKLEEGIHVQGIITNLDYKPDTMQACYEKGPVAVEADIKTYADDLPVLGFKVV